MEPTTSFYEAARQKNPGWTSLGDDDVYYSALTLAKEQNPDQIESWRERFPDFRERYDKTYNRQPVEQPKQEGGLVNFAAQHAGAFAEGMSRMGWNAVEGVSRNLADISRGILGDDNFLDSVEDFAADVDRNYVNDSFGVTDETRESFTGQLASVPVSSLVRLDYLL